MIGSFLRQLFGEERLTGKTRIPTLASMAAAGIDVPGFSNPHAPKTEAAPAPALASAGANAGEGATSLVPPPTAAEVASSSKAMVRGAALAALVMVAMVGAFLGVQAFLKPSVATPPAPGTAAVTPVALPVGPGGGTENQPPKGPDEQVPAPIGSTAVVPIPTPMREPRPEKKIRLTAGIIEEYVNKNTSNIMKCPEVHRAELDDRTGDQLKFSVTFTIVSSGRVSNAELAGDIAGSRLARCFEGKIRNIKFPAHLDQEVTLTQPFTFNVK
jgi:serine/threonine-protein kinase